MSIFWTMFFLGFIGVPGVVLIASLTSGKDSGFQKDTSHMWVYMRSGAKAKNASVRDVWKHQHPGKSWAQHQESIFITFAGILVVGFLVFLFWLSGEVFTFPQASTAQRLFWQLVRLSWEGFPQGYSLVSKVLLRITNQGSCAFYTSWYCQ